MPVRFYTAATRKGLSELNARVEQAARSIVTDSAHVIEAVAASKLHVGYGVRSGTMRRSGRVDGPHKMGLGRIYADVGPTIIYARRFELGFVGPDSLGRTFPYRPRPYWKPAVEESHGAVNKIAARRWRDAAKGN